MSDCKCIITHYKDGMSDELGPARVVYCPLHRAAPALLDVAKRVWKHAETDGTLPVLLLQDIEAAIAAATEKQ